MYRKYKITDQNVTIINAQQWNVGKGEWGGRQLMLQKSFCLNNKCLYSFGNC